MVDYDKMMPWALLKYPLVIKKVVFKVPLITLILSWTRKEKGWLTRM